MTNKPFMCIKMVEYYTIQFTGDNVAELLDFGDGDIKYVKKNGKGKQEDFYQLEYHEPEMPFSYDIPKVTTINVGDYCVLDDGIVKVYTEKEFTEFFKIKESWG